MSFRRGTLLAAVAVIAVVAMVLIIYAINHSRPVADGYTGHAASPTPASASATPDTPDTLTDASAASGSSGPAAGTSAPSPSSTDTYGSTPAGSDHPTWNPAEKAGAAATQPKVPDGVGTEPYRLPEVPERRPALTRVPEAATAEGRLAEGFPEDVIPVPDGATVQSSSVSPQDRRVLVGLHVLSDEASEALLDLYATRCSDLGWAVSMTPDPAGGDRLHCGYLDDSMTVAARQLPTGRVDLTVAGAFLVAEKG